MNQRKVKYWVVPAVIVLLLLGAAKYAVNLQNKGHVTEQVSAVAVTTAQVISRIAVPKLVLNGSVEGETSGIISAKISGRIAQVLVEDGQRVGAGQPLVQLESLELANSVRMAEDALRRAQANYDNVQTDYNRYLTLYKQGAVSSQLLDGAATKLKVAEADLSSAAASLSTAKQQYEYAVVTAPVEGVVANKTAVIGQVVAAGAPLMSVEKIGQVYAVVNLEQKDMGMIRQGMGAQITVDAYPDKVFVGKVEIINPAAASSNRMFRTKIKLENQEGLLHPGMFVKAEIVIGKETPALFVPQSAIFQKQGMYYAYIVSEGKAVRQRLEVGHLSGEDIEIKSGLTEGMQVVTSNISTLKDQDAIMVTR